MITAMKRDAQFQRTDWGCQFVRMAHEFAGASTCLAASQSRSSCAIAAPGVRSIPIQVTTAKSAEARKRAMSRAGSTDSCPLSTAG